MKKVIKKLKLFGATFGLATSIVCSSPVVLHAEEEEVLWENNQDDHHEEDINDFQPDNSLVTPTPAPTPVPTKQVTLDDTNWDPSTEPNAGLEIPDYVKTEAERKGLVTPPPTPDTPTPDTPTPDTSTPDTPTPNTPTPEPTPIPKTGECKKIILAIASGLAASAIAAIIIKSLGYLNDENAIDMLYGTENEESIDIDPSCEDIAYSDSANEEDEIKISKRRN